MPVVVRLYVLPKGNYSISKCDYVIPRRCPPNVCAFQGQRWHVTPNIIRVLVLPKGDDGIEPTISSTMYAVKRS